MTSVFKKKYTAFLVMLMAITAQVNGIDYNQSTYCETDCYCKPNFCDFQIGSLNFHADLLYWRPELCGLESAFGNTTIATTVSQSAITTTTVKESDKEPDFRWNTGFRIGTDATFGCFDLALDWTHFKGHAKFCEHKQHGNWRIKYDVIDLILSRQFCMMSCFQLKPYIGLRGALIHQKLKSQLKTLFTSPLLGNNTVFTSKDDKEDFWGIGPQIGLDVDWYLGCNFSLYGSFAVVTYYGDVKGKNFDTDTFTKTVSVCNGKRKHCFNNIGTDAELGIRWDRCLTCLCNCEVNLMLKLGLEQHRIYDFSNLGSDGTLSLDGGVFAAGISFVY